MRGVFAAVVALVSVLVATSGARADEMDISLARLRQSAVDPAVDPDTTCSSVVLGPDGMPSTRLFCPDADQWNHLMAQLGASIAPPVLAPARTLGYGGLYVGLEGWITGIDSSADYWHNGTEGEAADAAEGRNRFPDDVLIWSRLEVRKGFPFGFELGTSLSHMLNSTMWAFGLDIKWALFEGFRTGIGVLPDIAVRGAVNTMTGDGEFNVTVPTVDVLVSKPIVLARTGTITPYLGGQAMWIFADSELVDLTPDVDAFTLCNPDPAADALSCRGDGADFNNNAVFPRVRNTRWRGIIGAQGRYQVFTLTAAFMFDLIKPHDADAEAPEDLPRQWRVDVGAGVTY